MTSVLDSATPPSVVRAVDVFADLYDRGRAPSTGRYQSRIPGVLPDAGQQYCFEVDLDACTGCKACVAACHSLNGLDEDELWRTVGLLQSVAPAAPEQRTVTTACHHCADPACLNGCPVNAYEKDVITGVVVHLDDQCIGCSYCTFMCPYEVPVFNERLGIVRKCDMCHGRLAAGEAPACVQGCPNAAIRIGITAPVGAGVLDTRTPFALVPGAPPSSITSPTTRYLTSVAGILTDVVATSFEQADPGAKPAHAHPPLVAMLLLVQVASGLAIADRGGRIVWLTVAVGLAGAASSALHLGRPQHAWKVVLGVGHSWLSREAVAIGAFVAANLAHALFQSDASWLIAMVAGAAVTYASARVYADTQRAMWQMHRTLWRFGVVVGLSALFAAAALYERSSSSFGFTAMVVAAGMAIVDVIRAPRYEQNKLASLRRSAWLLNRDLAPWHRTQVLASIAAVSATGLFTAFGGTIPLIAAGLAAACSFIAQRTLFFSSVSPDRMPW